MTSLGKRVLSGIVMLAVALTFLLGGTLWVGIGVFIVFGLALAEYVHLVARRGHRVFSGLMILWLGMFVASRLWPEAGLFAPGVSTLLLVSLAWSIIRFRQGEADAMIGFALTLGGSFYIGWAGSYLVSLRAFDDGLFWTLTVFCAVIMADTAAYLFGKSFGRTPLIPDVSPRKTWEGYLSGILFSTLITALMPLVWQRFGASSSVAPVHGMVLGFVISTVGPVGDFAISALKRYCRTKNTSNLIPGHGGILDRIDVLSIGVLLGYHYIDLVVF